VTLAEKALTVRTRQDLVRFLDSFSADFVANRAAWNNADLESFLAALAAWAQDMEGFYENRGEHAESLPPWRILADLLMAARVYE
jgi:hypothetical protein